MRPSRASFVLGSFPVGSEPFVLFVRQRSWIAVVTLCVAACRAPDATPARAAAPAARAAAGAARAAMVDDFGDTLRLADPASRIVSLNPVVTEALFAIGAGGRVTGRTHWDQQPPAARAVPDLGNGMQPNVEAVLATKPDLVVLYASNANRAAAQAFRRAGVPTLTLRTDRMADLPRTLAWLGLVTGDTTAARVVADSVAASLATVQRMAPAGRRPTVFWHVWDVPVVTIGAGSYLDELVTLVGARNVFGDLAQPSPQVTLESVAQRDPDYVLAGPVAAARLRTEQRWQAVRAVREHRVLVVDTVLVGRPGVRMGEAARHLRALLDSAARSARP